jgi:DNA-binding beta-propeller fold protein YncE
MKHLKHIVLLFLITASANACKDDEQEPVVEGPGESPIPELYLDGNQNNPEILMVHNFGSASILKPRDLEFHPDINQLWVMNKGANGSDFVIIDNPGGPDEKIIKRKDSHSGHFVVNGTGIAFSNANTFATAPEIKNTTSNANSTFMGPALWSSNLDVFANIYQSNWAQGQPLGSHYDMLHQSPFSMGIAHDKDNSFWVFDGYFKNLCHYEFVNDHGPGAEYHGDGKIHRHTDVKLERVNDVPSHMVVDKKTGLLYICDTYNGRVIKVDAKTGSFVKNLTAPNETLAEYQEVNGATVDVLVSGLDKPCGIDIKDDRLFVSDYETGMLYVYDTKTNEELAKFDTGQPGNTGIEISKEGVIWLLNYTNNTLSKIVRK